MFVVLGATGHVGSAVADALLAAGEAVTVVTRYDDKAARWRRRGAEAVVADVADVDELRAAFGRARRAFLPNPPASPSTDTDAEEHRTARCIAAALDGTQLEKVVAQSTYGAQPGDCLGDLSTLYDFEQALAALSTPVTVLRAAYFMSNWDAMLPAARQGTLPTMFPADVALPMVAPADIGATAARLLREAPADGEVRYVEGPARYSPADVAAAFSAALGREVTVAVTPRGDWEAAYRSLGFSDAAASAYARMTAATVDGEFPDPNAAERGATTLEAYVDALVAAA